MDGTKPHVVIVPYPAQGHLSPMVYFSMKLAAEGITVTLVNVESIHRSLTEQWISQPGLDIRLRQVPFGCDVPAGMDSQQMNNLSSWAMAIDSLKEPLKLLLSELQPAPRCIISDYSFIWCNEAPKALGIPSVIYWPGSAAWSSLHHHVKLLLESGDVCQGPKMRQDERVLHYIPGIDAIEIRDLPAYMQQEEMYHVLGKSSDRLKECDWVLVNSMPELEPQVFEAMYAAIGRNFIGVAPLFHLVVDGAETVTCGSLRTEDQQCLDWLNGQGAKSVLYISFGSISLLSRASFEELAAGLVASKQAFIWAIRPGSVEGMDDYLETFAKGSREQGLVVPWAPQLKILAHGSVGGFLSHCGWNSIMESFCNSVPILGWPFHSEQSMNCKLIEELGFGKRFSRKEVVSRTEVESIIKEFMGENETMAEMRMKLEGLKGLAMQGVSHTNLKMFIDEIKFGRCG